MSKYIRTAAIAGLIAGAAVLAGCYYGPGPYAYGPRYADAAPYGYAPYYGGNLEFSFHDHGWDHGWRDRGWGWRDHDGWGRRW